jgi:hypothetical protein
VHRQVQLAAEDHELVNGGGTVDVGGDEEGPLAGPVPRVSPLTSQVAFRLSSAVPFSHRRLSEVFTDPAETTCSSRSARSICPAFRPF